MDSDGGGGGDDCQRPGSTTIQATADPHSMHKRKTMDPENQQEKKEEEEEERSPIPACVIDGSKHADGSIYRQDTHFCHRLYRLDDTRESTHALNPVSARFPLPINIFFF